MAKEYYTGVGSRETPKEHCMFFHAFGIAMDHAGIVLRSGGAKGADIAFEKGALYDRHGNLEIYYHKNDGFYIDNETYFGPNPNNWDVVMEIAKSIHPNWKGCSSTAKAMHARNCYQVLGHNLDKPSSFLLCYSPPKDGSLSGGTRTAWELAKRNGIPVFNSFNAKQPMYVIINDLIKSIQHPFDPITFLEEHFNDSQSKEIFSW